MTGPIGNVPPHMRQFVARRIQMGLTQLDVAELSGYNQNTISRIETGFTMPSIIKYTNLLNSVGLDIQIVDLVKR